MTNRTHKIILRAIFALSLLTILFVLLLNRRFSAGPSAIPQFAYFLPKINATINSLCLILLVFSYMFVKRKNYKIHKVFNISAFLLSIAFLISYTLYHYLVPETSFGGVGVIKTVYFFILFSHILASVFLIPLVLLAFYYALSSNFIIHKKIVKWAYPVWVYVSFTGVLVYLLLSPYYNFPIFK